MINTEKLKKYIKIEHDDEDDLIQELAESAKLYIERSSGKEYLSDPVWDMAIMILTAHLYWNRQLFFPNRAGVINEIPHSFTAHLNHISLSSAYKVKVLDND